MQYGTSSHDQQGSRYASPRLVICPSRVLPPVEYCRGTSPSQAANCRPFLKSRPLPTVATRAEAVIGPMPLRVWARTASALERTCTRISCSYCWILAASALRAPAGLERRLRPAPAAVSSSKAPVAAPPGAQRQHMPNSASNPRSRFSVAVRSSTKPWRTRCRLRSDCCSKTSPARSACWARARPRRSPRHRCRRSCRSCDTASRTSPP